MLSESTSRGSGETLGFDWFNPVGNVKSSLELSLEATVSVKAPQAELLVLSEDRSQPINPICRVVVNGTEVAAVLSGPDLGYAGTWLSRPEPWLFLRFPLTSGENRIQLEMLTRSELPTVSVWAAATGCTNSRSLHALIHASSSRESAWLSPDVSGSRSRRRGTGPRHGSASPRPPMLPEEFSKNAG